MDSIHKITALRHYTASQLWPFRVESGHTSPDASEERLLDAFRLRYFFVLVFRMHTIDAARFPACEADPPFPAPTSTMMTPAQCPQ